MVQILIVIMVFTGFFFAEIIVENVVRLKIPEKYMARKYEPMSEGKMGKKLLKQLTGSSCTASIGGHSSFG